MPIYCDSHVKTTNTVLSGGLYPMFISGMDDDTTSKIGNGGANGVMLISFLDFTSANRISGAAMFSWNSEWPSTIAMIGESVTHNGSTASPADNFQWATYIAAPNTAVPTSSDWGGAADNKITLWVDYPHGLYLINRSGVNVNQFIIQRWVT